MSSVTRANATGSTTFPETSVSHLALRSMFLSFFIIIGFVGNCLLIATIANSRRLRNSALNLVTLSLASAHVLDCVLNMPLVLGTTVTEKWDYGAFMCDFNSFVMELTCVTTYLHLLLMSFDRVIAVYEPDRYRERMTVLRVSLITLVVWILSLVFCIPILSGKIPSRLYPNMYVCLVSDGSTILYIALTSVACFMTPTVLIMTSVILITKWGIQEKLRSRSMLGEHQYTDTLIEPAIWRQIRGAIYVAVLLGFWCVLEGPYLLVRYSELYTNSIELSGKADTPFSFPDMMDLAFLWMNLSYVLILPFATFYFRKEVWQKFKDLILCKKSNHVVDSAPKPKRRHRDELDEKERQKIDRLFEKAKTPPDPLSLTTASFNAPVLFATTRGLRLQDNEAGESITEDDDDTLKESHDSVFFADMTSKSATFKTLKGKNCDVLAGSRELRSEDDNTSDYDSHNEVDPFSVSSPAGHFPRHDRTGSLDSEGKRSRKNSENETEGQKLSNSFGGENLRKIREEAFAAGFAAARKASSDNSIDGKMKKNKPKLTKVEHFAESAQSAAAIDEEVVGEENIERNSNDSGRGTYERQRREGKSSRPRIEISRVETADDVTTDAKSPPSSPTKTKNKKKKRKPKRENIELSEVQNISENGGLSTQETSAKQTRNIPSVKLKPLESKKPVDVRTSPRASPRASPRMTHRSQSVGGLTAPSPSPDPKRKNSLGNKTDLASSRNTQHVRQRSGSDSKRPVASRRDGKDSREMSACESGETGELSRNTFDTQEAESKSSKRRKGRSDSTQELLTNHSPR